jgi:hypothetical protein
LQITATAGVFKAVYNQRKEDREQEKSEKSGRDNEEREKESGNDILKEEKVKIKRKGIKGQRNKGEIEHWGRKE